MAKYIIEGETLQGLANALRKVTGETRTYTPTEMVDAVSTVLEKGVYILVDENGVELPAVFVDNETRFTATANDIRIGTTAVTEAGVTEGTKEIPNYRAEEGIEVVPPDTQLDISKFSDMCEYTVFQAIVCEYNTSIANSVLSKKVVIDDTVYNVGSTTVLAKVTVDSETQTIKLGVTNDSDKNLLIRYMIIKEDE